MGVLFLQEISAPPPEARRQHQKAPEWRGGPAQHRRYPAERRDGKGEGELSTERAQSHPTFKSSNIHIVGFSYVLHRLIVAALIPSLSQRLKFSTGWEASGRKSFSYNPMTSFSASFWSRG